MPEDIEKKAREVTQVTVKNLTREERANYGAQQDRARRSAWQRYQAFVAGESGRDGR